MKESLQMNAISKTDSPVLLSVVVVLVALIGTWFLKVAKYRLSFKDLVQIIFPSGLDIRRYQRS